MILGIGTNWHVENNLQYRLRKLHELTGMTHPQIVHRSGGAIRREELVKLEGGRSKASSHRIRKGLALGYGVTEDLMNRLIDDQATPEEVAAKVPPLSADELRPEPSANPSVNVKATRLAELPEWEDLLKTAMKRDPGVQEVAWERVSQVRITDAIPVTVDWVLVMGQAVEKQLRSMQALRQQRAPVGKFSARQTGQIKKPKRH